MKRIEEKVKDIVEVRSCVKLYDFTADSTETLRAYRFTDVTSDLMAKWLDRLTETKPGVGTAMALAGFRGVGKSHFLAAFGALAAHVDLRSKIEDSHVSARANRMARRHFSVAYVQRGKGASILAELKQGVAELLDCNPANLSESLHDLLVHASHKGGDSPTVILIDTALGRNSRVSRDDGPFLSEMAEAAKHLGLFVAIALDDDIAGADGVNAAISQSFEINYLDQEHLYKIVDSHIFPKNYQKRSVLHEIYEYYRSVLPGFNWSEERFAALYPLHPAILETAPFIRLYLHNFALLGFAAEAGVRILGRPANSLIALDEVFDNVEKDLRKIEDLKAVFEVFDTLDREVVAKVPVMKRLRAKLILKGLFLLSLDGEGTSAPNLAASMMIFDDEAPVLAVNEVAEVLASFQDAVPGALGKIDTGERDAKFFFIQPGKEDLNAVLSEKARAVSDEAVYDILRRSMTDKYVDLRFSEAEGQTYSDFSVVWNGGVRRGKVVWAAPNDQPAKILTGFAAASIDWIAIVTREGDPLQVDSQPAGIAVVEWRLAALRKDEAELVRRFYILQNQNDLRETFNEHHASALHRHSIAVDQIWKRIYLEDGLLVIDGFEFNLTDEAKAAFSLPLMFSRMLEPMFELRFPNHPAFERVLGIKETSVLINELFAESSELSEETQNLAKSFAVPLGLVAANEGRLVPVSGDVLIQLSAVKNAFSEEELKKEKVISLTDIYSRMARPPFGFTREIQHLILAALVSQRQIEFVTSSGNRINRRSLDLQIVWEDIVGIAKPSYEHYSEDRLLDWAAMLVKVDKSELEKGPRTLSEHLIQWLVDWEDANLLVKFDSIADEYLNARIWRISLNLKKSFQVVAAHIKELKAGTVSAMESLQSIADTFSDSTHEFALRKKDLEVLKGFCNSLAKCIEIEKYLSLAETTSSAEIETLRTSLFEAVSDAAQFDAEKVNDTWIRYKTLYAEHYQTIHDSVIHSSDFKDKFEQIRRSDLWFEFESFGAVPIFDSYFGEYSDEILKEIRQVKCSYNTGQLLKSQPFCLCSFTLFKSRRWEDLPSKLWRNVNQANESFRMFLKSEKNRVVRALDEFAEGVDDQDTLHAIDNLITISKHQGNYGRFSLREIQVLKMILSEEFKSDPNISMPLYNFDAGRELGIQQINSES